ncbi:MAG: hypothetical protein QXK18_07190 [Candidatus Bathyarchaeia archaeon]
MAYVDETIAKRHFRLIALIIAAVSGEGQIGKTPISYKHFLRKIKAPPMGSLKYLLPPFPSLEIVYNPETIPIFSPNIRDHLGYLKRVLDQCEQHNHTGKLGHTLYVLLEAKGLL